MVALKKEMHVRPIQSKDYSLVLTLDKKVYPTSSPVTLEILKGWYQRNPEFGLIYEKENKIVAVGIAIPLTAKAWKQLIQGKLSESALDASMIFDNIRDKEIGIHGYHLEKLDDSLKGLYKQFVKDLAKVVQQLQKTNKDLKVVGFSGLAVTKEGIHICEKLGYKEREFISKEYILEKDGKKIVFEAHSQKTLQEKIKERYTVISRCQMMVVYSTEQSIAWKYLHKDLLKV